MDRAEASAPHANSLPAASKTEQPSCEPIKRDRMVALDLGSKGLYRYRHDLRTLQTYDAGFVLHAMSAIFWSSGSVCPGVAIPSFTWPGLWISMKALKKVPSAILTRCVMTSPIKDPSLLMKKLNPVDKPNVERVRNTKSGHRDHWRSE